MSTHEIPLARPDITDAEIEAVTAVLRSGRLSIGPVQEQFERMVATRCGREHGVACSSGTAGLHLALLALGVGPGDEVITTPLSFIASANPILYVGATPVFVDVCPKTLNMDPARVEKAITRRTKAILAVEAFGNPAHLDAYAAVAGKHEIPIIEDACEALGCTLRGRPCGSFGRLAVFGFYPNKQITTGEGGMIVTDDRRLADLCRSLRSQGRPVGLAGAGTGPLGTGSAVEGGAGAGGGGGGGGSANGGAGSGGPALGTHAWLMHERLGYNYRLSEINAALGVVQMKRLDEIIEARQRVADLYIRRLMSVPDLILPTVPDEARMSWFIFVVRLAASYTREERDRVIDGIRRHEVGAADYFPCIHLQPFYRERFGFRAGDFPIAESVSARTLALPFYNQLTERDVDYVCATLELMLSRENLKRS